MSWRLARRRPVAKAIARGAQVRAALDHLARDAELGVVRVDARLALAAARVLRCTPCARRGSVGDGVPVRRPLPDVAGHVEQPVAVGGVTADRRGEDVAIGRRVLPGEVPCQVLAITWPSGRSSSPQVKRRRPARRGRRTPTPPRSAGACRPRRSRRRRPPGDVDHRVIGQSAIELSGPAGMPPVRAGRPGPPVGELLRSTGPEVAVKTMLPATRFSGGAPG